MNHLKKTGFALFCLLCFLKGICQEKKLLLKSWIRKEWYDLATNRRIDDTAYARYTFLKNKAYISMTAPWNGMQQDWQLEGNLLTIGFVHYTIEELTDSTLTISQQGFRRIVLEDESRLNQQAARPAVAGELNGEPVYETTRYITPRYKKDDYRNTLQGGLDGYNIKREITFVASFIVKKDGSVDEVRVIHGITDGFDAELVKRLKKTSGNWTPAVYQGQPVQTKMVYTIHYLDSPVKY
jgi:hypothetical protein